MARRRHHVVLRPALLAFFLFTGCNGCNPSGDGYAPEMTFTPRKDFLVDKTPTDAPQKDTSEGRLDDFIAELNGRGGVALNPADVPEPTREAINSFLRRMFGTPAAPTIAGDAETAELVAKLGLTNENLAAGSKLFRRSCADCHGSSGDGRGNEWLKPSPRDYRQGVFKFVSTKGTSARKPSRDDLRFTLQHGIPMTPMPSFAKKSEADRERLIDYVMYLSVRGATEFELLRAALKDKDDSFDCATDAPEAVLTQLRGWQTAQANALVVPDAPTYADDSAEQHEAIRRGHKLFLDQKGAGCIACHADYGRQGKYQYDVWGTLVKPRELTEPKRKGGDSADKLFVRIRGGIGASNMPAAATLSDAEIWDLVHFIRAMPYPDRLPPDVKGKVHGP